MAPRKSSRYSMSSNTSRGTSRSHTSSIAPAQLTERFRLLPSQWVPGLAPTYFLPPTGRIYKGIHTAPIMAQNLSDMWRSTFEISAAQLNSLRQNRTATASYPGQFALSEVTSHPKSPRTRLALLQPFLCVNRHPVRCDFSGGQEPMWRRKSFPV